MMYAQALLVRAQSRGINMLVAFIDMHEAVHPIHKNKIDVGVGYKSW
jgi:hypothetical protein